MIVSVIYALIYICLIVLVVYIIIWVLGQIGLAIPDMIMKIIWVIVALLCLLVIIEVVLGGAHGLRMLGSIPDVVRMLS